jgi:hypothetical protein
VRQDEIDRHHHREEDQEGEGIKKQCARNLMRIARGGLHED